MRNGEWGMGKERDGRVVRRLVDRREGRPLATWSCATCATCAPAPPAAAPAARTLIGAVAGPRRWADTECRRVVQKRSAAGRTATRGKGFPNRQEAGCTREAAGD